jgi:superfamily II DNA or RNA helicase
MSNFFNKTKNNITNKFEQKKNNYEKEEMPQNLNTYLGQKGYTILKSELPIAKQIYIKEQLMIKPFVMGSPIQVEKSYPAYRESDKKLYVPRYFGEKMFGPPKEIKISEGTNINLTFNGSLRDYQSPVVNEYLEHVQNGGGGLLELYCAWGKTSASLYICCALKKKTLVIVHKEFLLNQWVERIQQFIPNARIGKIQGQIVDIDNKDIVLCMLQSLSMKDYPSSLFDSFGFTIIDEVHHISSETFSCALFKLVTKYMLGLSATMNRKDGTTNVFKMFLGEVVHKAERKNEVNVEIRAVTFKTNDEEFNEPILDFRGKPQNSSMITKLCSYSYRTEFIIKLLTDFIREKNIDIDTYQKHKSEMDKRNPICYLCEKNDNYLVKNTCCNQVKYCLPCIQNIKPIINIIETNGKKKQVTERIKCPDCKKVLKYEQNYIINHHIQPLEKCQTIVLAHNLNVLEYIYNKFICKNLASVGYYIGGMNEQELKQSEKKQVILATFAIANEGLDIPTLNAEFLITPKTDIVQTVGRVLRAKHKYADPIIYDIIDSHDVFQNQWNKRKAYYKKNNYRIILNDSIRYNTEFTSWKILNDGTFIKDKEIKDNTSDSDSDSDKNSPIKLGVCLLKIKK